MKKLLFVLLINLLSFQGYAQDPNIYQTWYLMYAEVDLGDPYLIVEDVNPPISPSLTISENLDFTGFGACNSFSGDFMYENDPNYGDILTAQNFSQTNNSCEFQQHTTFENNYFYYFNTEGLPLIVSYWEDVNNGVSYLDLEMGPGFLYHFQNTPLLSINNNDIVSAVIYPNPVSNTLFVSSENNTVQSVSIYSVLGTKVKNISASSVNSINVSNLSKGIYFIEIYSTEGKIVKKFIKK